MTVFEVLLALFVLSGLFVLFFLDLDGPTTLDESRRDLLALGENVCGYKWVLMRHVMVVFVGGMECGVLDEFLER